MPIMPMPGNDEDQQHYRRIRERYHWVRLVVTGLLLILIPVLGLCVGSSSPITPSSNVNVIWSDLAYTGMVLTARTAMVGILVWGTVTLLRQDD
jgi:hypothetical protein